MTALLSPLEPVLAHGIGVRGDLPIPLWMATYGAAAVLVLSFLALGALWPEPRLEGRQPGIALGDRASRVLGWAVWPLRVVGAAGAAFVWWVALTGPVAANENLASYAVYIGLWVGGLFASGLVGDWWRLLNPAETAVQLSRGARDGGPVEPLDRVGVWPAAVLLLAFAWLELVHPSGAEPRTLAIAIGVFVATLVLGAAWWGVRWIRSADVFGVTFSTLAAMAPLHRDDRGRLRLRAPLVGTTDLPTPPGTVALVVVLLGSTTFDGLSGMGWWEELVGTRIGWAAVPVNTAGLVVTVAVVGAVYWWAMAEASRRTGQPTRDLADAFVHSLIPIALAYAVAHYFSLLAFESNQLAALASDPFALGWDLFGTADWRVDYRAVSPATIAYVQVGAIVAGHVAGVVLAHDRAVARFAGRDAVRSQLALLVAMVAYTVGGLVLLLGG